MRGTRILLFSLLLVAIAATAGISTKPQYYDIKAGPDTTVVAGRNVNMVSGTTLPDGDPWLQRQNEPSIAVSTRNPLHLLAGANDYRTVDMPTSEGELPGADDVIAAGDAWLGVFESYDGGQSWRSTLLPGFPQDPGNSPLKGYQAAADPVVRAGPNGIFYFSGIVFNRNSNEGAVFVARFIDDNNKEGDACIRYLDTKIIAVGTADDFLDKPWIAVDKPRLLSGKVNVGGQRIPRHNVYLAYSKFRGEGASLKSDIMFVRTLNCGNRWQDPIKISKGNFPHQGASIAIKPVDGAVFVTWRRFARTADEKDAIFVAKSLSRGRSFQQPRLVANVAPFDQPATDHTTAFPNTGFGPSFRSNSYPSIAADDQAHVYIVWSERAADASGHARIVLSMSFAGYNWSSPVPIANHDEQGVLFLGHQIMPSITVASGKILTAWYDLRNDVCGHEYGFNDWIIDDMPLRHTMDVWAAQADISTFPDFQWKYTQVSRYLYALKPDNSIIQAQYNPPNYPLFKGGLLPFDGDYIDLSPSPMFVLNKWGRWEFNTESSDSAVFHVAWTDNRDVRPPINNNWEVYNPPTSTQTLSDGQFFVNTPCTSPENTGMRNQNIYTSILTSALEAGMPGNNKPLGTLGTNPANGEMIPRAFVLFVKNPTGDIRHYRLQITEMPASGTASFLEYEMLDRIDVSIAPYSSISRPLFVTSSDEKDNVTLEVFEIEEVGGNPLPGGAQSTVIINPDETAPEITGDLKDTEVHDPDIDNPNIVNWTYVNPNIVNPNIVNPNIVNPNIVNPNIVNPNIVNPNIVNPNIVNPNIVNPNIVNPNIVNPNIVNPNIVNSSIESADVTDVTWPVRNNGNTISSYTFKIFAKDTLPEGIYAQLLVYKVHYTPATDGSSCELKQTPHHELLLNIVNPNIVNPNIVNPNIVNPNIVNSSIENATFFLGPGEEAEAVLRLVDPEPGTAKFLQSGKKFRIQQFAQSLGAATGSQALDSSDAQEGDTTVEADATELIIITSGLPDGTVDEIYPNPSLPGIQLEATGGDGTYVWSANSAQLPLGLGCSEDGVIGGVPQAVQGLIYPHIYNFIVQASSGGEVATQNLSITINSAEEPTPPLNIVTTSLTPGTVGDYYGATLQATGGTPPRTWSKISGALPPGLSLDAGGVISGTIIDDANVSYPHTYTFTVQVKDASQDTDTQSLSIMVDEIVLPDLTISGTITDEYGSPVSGVSIYGLPNSPQTDSYGYYSTTVPHYWSGTTTPFKAGYNFQVSLQDPTPSRTYYEITTDQYSQDFVATSINYTISGRVTFYGSPLQGVTMNGLPGTPTTNANGFYIAAIPFNWSGTVIPQLQDYIFQPSSRTYSLVKADKVLQDYAATFVGAGQDDPFEDNDTFATATDLSAGIYENMQLHDDDWYRVNVTQGTDLKIIVNGEYGNNIDVEVLESSGSRIIGAYGEAQDETVFATDLDAGWHYIRVIYLGTTGFWNAYDLTITLGSGLGNGDITGNVSNITDDALADVEITAYSTQSDHYFATTTDSNGDYKLSLPPSLYKLFFDASAIGPPHYVSVYYDNRLNFENADTIDVQAGMNITGIDAVLELESVLSVITTSLPDGNLATPYNAQLEAAGGVEPYTWNLISGSLPDGLNLQSSGLIGGTPTTLGTYDFTVEVTDSTSPLPQTASQALSITINPYAGTEFFISGAVEFNSAPLPGVILQGLPGDPVTNIQGEYTAIVYSGWSGTVTPILGGHAFDPASRTYNNVNSSFTEENYTASAGLSISGEVTLDGSPLGSVVMSGLPGDPYTDENGQYAGAVPSGWSGTVTPILPGFTFNPPSIPYTDVQDDQTGQDYTTNFQGGQDDIYEDNDAPASAAEVTFGTYMNLVLDDEDWFKIYIPAGNEDKDLRINIRALSYPQPDGYEDLDLIAVDASEKMLGYTLSSSDDETLYLTDIEEGWYYFGQNYISQPGTVYALTVELSDNFGIGYISGRVTDGTTGQPIEGIYVEIYDQPFDWANPRPLITTDANGEYKIGFIPGNYTLNFNDYVFNMAYAPDRNYIPKTYNANEILSILPGTTVSGIDAQLRPGGIITGRVTDADGIGVNNGVIYIYRSDTVRVAYAYTDGNGDYRAERVPTGNFKVRARSGTSGSMWYGQKGSFEDGHPVAAKESLTTTNIDIQVEESAIIEGHVTDSGHNPIQDVYVEAYDVSGILLWSTYTDSDGNYWMGRRLPTGEVKLHFDASGAQGNYASEYYEDKWLMEDADPVSVQAGQNTVIDVELADGGTISGRVIDAQDNGFAGVAVHCFDTDSDRVYGVNTDADGNFTISGLLPDNYKVRFRTTYGDYATQWYNGGNSFDNGTTVPVGAGANISGIDTKLWDNGGFISGRVTNTSGNGIQEVFVLALDITKESAVASTYTNSGGYYTIPRIPEGSAKIHFNTDSEFLNFMSEFYSDKSTHATADSVTVTFGLETTGVNAVLAPIPPINITTTSLPNGEVATPYEIALEAMGGREFFHWSLISGTLPPGLMLNSKGEISGTPTASGTHNFTVRVTDSSRDQLIDTQSLSITVDAYAGPGNLISGTVASGGSPLAGVVLQGLPGNPVTSANGQYIVAVPQGWSGTATPMRSGYYFDPQNREYVDVDSNVSGQDYTAYELTLNITTEWLLDAVQGSFYSQSLRAEGGSEPYNWTLTSGSLPYGFDLDNNGTISGTTSHDGEFNFTVRLADSSSPPQSVEKDLRIFSHGGRDRFYSENPKLYWKLDEGDGTIAQDSSGNGVRGTLQGSAFYTNDSVAGFAVGIGTNGWIERETAGVEFNFANQAAFVARVKIDDFSQPKRFVWKHQYDFPPYGHPYSMEILLEIEGDQLHLQSANGMIEGLENCQYFHTYVDLSNAQNGFSLGQFNQIIVMIQENTYTICINGDQVVSESGAHFEINDSVQNFWIGGADWSDYWLGGIVDEIMAFNRILETEEVDLIWATSTFPTISGTVLLNDVSPLPWVRMNGLIGDPQVQEDGTYIGIVEPGWSGTVTPQMGGYYFAPPSRFYSEVPADIAGENYTAYEGSSLWIETSSLPNGKKGESYSTTLTAADGVEPYTWSVVSGRLPNGLELVPGTGNISGLPTEAGDFSFTVRVLDSDSPPRAAERLLYLFVSAAHQGFWTTTYPNGGNMHSKGLALDHSNPSVIFSTAENRGIFRSSDGGSSWDNLIEDPNWPYWESDYRIFLIHQGTGDYFLCPGGRIYRSTDSGATWEQIYETEDWDISALAVDPVDSDITYYGTWDGELYKTTDGGANWSVVGAGLPGNNEITLISIDPNQTNTLYAGTNDSGIYKSTDGGVNWSPTNGSTDFSWVEDIKIDPSGKIYVMAWTYSSGGGLYFSADGATWEKLLDANPGWSSGNSIAIDPTDADIIYVVSEHNVIKTIDAGDNWTTYPVSSAHTEAIAIDPMSPQTLYAATAGEGVWKSVNGGVTWAKASNGIRALGFVHDDPHSLEIDESNSNYIYSGSLNGGYRSLNFGASWEKMDHPSGSILALFTHTGAPGNVYAYHNALEISDSYGASGSWETAPGFMWGFSRGDFGMAADDSDIIYVGTWDGGGESPPPTGVYKTTDGGLNFTLMNTGLDPSNTEVQTIAVHPGNQPGDHDVVFVGLRRDWPYVQGKDYGLYKTTDGGNNWYKITSGLPWDFFARQIVFDPNDPSTLYIVGETENDCDIYRSDDEGESWLRLYAVCGNTIAVNPDNPEHLYVGSWDGMYVSLNGGNNWIFFNDGLPPNPHDNREIHSIALDPADPLHVFIGSHAGVYEATFSFDFMITTENLPSGIVGETYSVNLETAGGEDPVIWELASGGLPQGLTFNEASGALSGTPIETGYWDITIKATDNSGKSYTKQYGLNVLNKYYLTVGTNPEGVGSVSVDPFEPWYVEGSMVDVSLTIPPTYTFIGWNGDASGTSTLVHVQMTKNKNLTAHFALTSNLPDYRIDSLNAPSTANAGDTIGGSVSAIVGNNGDDDLFEGDISVGVYLSNDPSITTSDMLLWKGLSSISPLNGGSSTPVSIHPDLQIPSTVSAGSYYIGVLVDESHLIAERDEGNNTAAQPITVTETGAGYFDVAGVWSGGSSYGLAVDEARNLAFVGNGGTFEVLDVSDPSHPVKISSLYISPSLVCVIVLSGNTAYLAAGTEGLVTVDVSDPHNPTRLGTFCTQGMHARSLDVSGAYAFVADYHHGLRVVDVSNPAAPTQAGFLELSEMTREVKVFGDFVYVSVRQHLATEGIQGLRVIDISTPSNPTLCSTYEIPDGVGIPDMDASGRYLYAPDNANGVRILDTQDPYALNEVGHYSGVIYPTEVQIIGNYAFVDDTTEAKAVILDITDPLSPLEISSYWFAEQQSLYGFEVAGDLWLINRWYDSIRVLDISDINAPAEVGSYEDIEGLSLYVDVSDDAAFIVDTKSYADGLKVLDISNFAHITKTTRIETPYTLYGIAISGNYAYLPTWNNGLRVFDISDPAHPFEAGSCEDLQRARDVVIRGHYAYVADAQDGLRILDISVPTNPSLVSTWDTEGYVYAVAVQDHYAYVSDLYWWSGLRVIDIADPLNPFEVGYLDFPNGEWRVREMAASGDHVYLIQDYKTCKVIDVSDPQNPSEVASFETYYPANLRFSGNLLFISDWILGLRVMDVSSPSSPTQVDLLTRVSGAWGFVIRENLLYIADRDGSFVILEHKRPGM